MTGFEPKCCCKTSLWKVVGIDEQCKNKAYVSYEVVGRILPINSMSFFTFCWAIHRNKPLGSPRGNWRQHLHCFLFAPHFSLSNSRWWEVIFRKPRVLKIVVICRGQDLSPEMQKKRLEQEQAGWQKRVHCTCGMALFLPSPGIHLSHEKNPGWLGFIGDYTTSYMGIIINHYKDPY